MELILQLIRIKNRHTMESKKELYHHGLNPNYFEAFSEEMCSRVLFELELLQIPYTRVPHQDNEIKSLRFYLPNARALTKLRRSLQNAHPSFRQGDAYEKYELVYENSFV